MKTIPFFLLASLGFATLSPALPTAPETAPAASVERETPALPPAPPRRPPPMPDPATIPGAETRTASDFDLTDSGYVVEDGKWLALAPDAEAGTVETTIEVGRATRFLVLFDAVPDERGSFPVQIEVGEIALPLRYIRPDAPKIDKNGAVQLRWRDVPIAAGDVIKVSTRRGDGDGEEKAHGRWSRIIFIPLDADPREAMRGGPPSMVPPPPPPPRAATKP